MQTVLEPKASLKKMEAAKNSSAWRAYESRSNEEEILKNHLPLVRSVVDRMKASLPAHVEVEDLYSVGVVGLIHASRKYDSSHGASFTSFAITRIRGAILDELRRMDWMSRSCRDKAKKLSDVISEFEQRVGRPATEKEIADELGLTSEEYSNLLDEVKPVSYVELDSSEAEGEGGTLHDVIADENQTTASDEVAKRELLALVVDRVEKLPEMQRKVLGMYYFENLRLAEIAEVFGVTESRICQIHTQAVLALRTYTQSILLR
jgi:RNA polymerase sigma factor for flagellar operon FliA